MKVAITLDKSLIGRRPNQIKTAQALGLKKIHQTVIKESNPQIQGMIATIAHLITVKESV